MEEVAFESYQFQQCLPSLKLQWFYELEEWSIFCFTFCMKMQVWGNEYLVPYELVLLTNTMLGREGKSGGMLET